MANPHSTDLYAIGKGVLQIAEFSGGAPGTYTDVGNCPRFEMEPAIERLAHYSSRSGFRTKDKNPIVQTEYTVNFDLDEMAASNMAKFLMGTLTEGFEVLGLQATDKEYALRFTSDNPTGPNQVWDLWRVTLSPGGPIQLIGEDWMIMSFSGEGLADTVNNPTSPYFTVNYSDTYTETSASESSVSSESSESV
jgi:hypothetical protein